MRGNVAFPMIKLGGAEIFFLPDAVLVVSKGSVAALHYRDLDFSYFPIRYIEEGRVPSDTTILGETWRFVNKSGGPDRRFNSNRQLPICQYGEMNFSSTGGLNGKMEFSNSSAGQKFAKALEILIRHAASSAELSPIASYREAKHWPSVAFILSALLIGGSLMAFGVQAISLVSSPVSNATQQINGRSVDTVPAKNEPPGRKVGTNKASAPLNILPVPSNDSSVPFPKRPGRP
jgi:hypothetical protein